MITVQQIQRLSERLAYGQLLGRVLDNGRGGRTPAMRHLSREGLLAPAALGLSLQRCVELSYQPTPVAAMLARRLVRLQRKDGHFGPASASEGVAAATAVALRGLLALAEQLDLAGTSPAWFPESTLKRALERGLAALTAAQRSDGTFGGGLEDAAIVLWQLGDCPAFRHALRFDALLRAIDGPKPHVAPDGLRGFAHAVAA